MYNIYKTHGEVMTEDAKIRFLLKNIQHSGLDSVIEAMNVSITTEIIGTVSYTTVANHTSTSMSQLPEYLSRNRKISSIQSNEDNSNTNSIYKSDGYTNTGHLDN